MWVNPIWRILAVQLFQPMFRHQFRIEHTNIVNSLLIKRYALLHWQSADFLFMLFAVPKISETFLQLGDVNYEFTIVQMVSEICLTQLEHIASAINAMKSRKAEEEVEDD